MKRTFNPSQAINETSHNNNNNNISSNRLSGMPIAPVSKASQFLKRRKVLAENKGTSSSGKDIPTEEENPLFAMQMNKPNQNIEKNDLQNKISKIFTRIGNTTANSSEVVTNFKDKIENVIDFFQVMSNEKNEVEKLIIEIIGMLVKIIKKNGNEKHLIEINDLANLVSSSGLGSLTPSQNDSNIISSKSSNNSESDAFSEMSLNLKIDDKEVENITKLKININDNENEKETKNNISVKKVFGY